MSLKENKLDLPADLMDCIRNMGKWQETFGSSRGIILLVIAIKFPIARKFFVAGYAAAASTSEVHRVYLACVAMVFKFGEAEQYGKLAEDIDAIKGPLYCHGLLTYMRKLGIVKTSRNSEGIRLGLGPVLVRVVPYNASIAKKITSFMQMSPVLMTLPIAKNLTTYGDNLATVSKAMTWYNVPNMGRAGYNLEWTFRSYEIADCRYNGIQRLGYGLTDDVSMLPGPDGKNARRKLGPERCVADLYDIEGIRTFPEYICLAVCLRSGKYKGNIDKNLSIRIAGRCSTCVRNKKSIHFCRVSQMHTRRTTLRPTVQVL